VKIQVEVFWVLTPCSVVTQPRRPRLEIDLVSLTILYKEYKLGSALLYNVLRMSVTPSFSRPKSLLSALFSYAVSLYYSLSVGNQISRSSKSRDNITILYTLIFSWLR